MESGDLDVLLTAIISSSFGRTATTDRIDGREAGVLRPSDRCRAGQYVMVYSIKARF